jgi:S1-C subfamily serine protease
MNWKKTLGYAAITFVMVFGAVVLALQYDRRRTNDSLTRILNSPEVPSMTVQNAPGAQSLADFRVAARKVLPSVVSIETAARGRSMFDREVSLFPAGSGSGVVISADGYIVTNNHVVTVETRTGRVPADAVRVELSDGKSFNARVVGLDPRADLALLKIEATGLTPIEFAPRNSVEVGQWVMALGNPMGYENTLSVGVVSSLGRSLPTDEGAGVLIDSIQTDAAINPGNSGGALCDANGRLIGINTAIISQTGGSIGIGFAIPINRVERPVRDIRELGYVPYAGLGVTLLSRPISLEIAINRQRIQQETGMRTPLPDHGLLIPQVDPQGPAGRAGMRDLSVLFRVGDREINELADYHQALLNHSAGDRVEIEFWVNGETKTAEVVLADVGRG